MPEAACNLVEWSRSRGLQRASYITLDYSVCDHCHLDNSFLLCKYSLNDFFELYTILCTRLLSPPHLFFPPLQTG